MMFSGVPNLVYTLGYINASWTLRSELVAKFVCRLVNHLVATGLRQCTPRLRASDHDMKGDSLFGDFKPGYLQRAVHLFPRQGDRAPWQNTQNYLHDREHFARDPLEDGVLQYGNPAGKAA
jgi:hypothetical protein